FCNTTATTEIYTLSLHDALPICQFQENAERGTMNDEQEELHKPSSDEAQRPAPSDNSSFILHPSSLSSESGRPYWQSVARIGIQDRKSTRLNSSHLVISYAVFCL